MGNINHTFPIRAPWLVPLGLIICVAFTWLAHGPLYLGLVLAWFWTAVYARWLGASKVEIRSSTVRGMISMWRVCVVLLLIGGVIGLWMQCGAIQALTVLGERVINGSNVLWVSFLLAAGLSMTVGSSMATWSVLGPPLLALVPASWAPVLAGALVSGGMVGDRSSPMSTSLVLLGQQTGASPSLALRQMVKTMILPATGSTLFYAGYHLTHRFHTVNTLLPTPTHGFTPVILPCLMLILAMCRIPLLWNLLCTMAMAFGYGLWEGASWLACTVALFHGLREPTHSSSVIVGGIAPMCSAVLLIISAGAFQSVAAMTGSIQHLVQGWLQSVKNPRQETLVTYGLCAMFSLLMGSQMLSIVMSGTALQAYFQTRYVTASAPSHNWFLHVLGDSAELFPALVPWNLLGLQSVLLLHVPTWAMAPYAVFIPLMTVWSMWRYHRNAKSNAIHTFATNMTLTN